MFIIQDDGSEEPYISCNSYYYKQSKEYIAGKEVSLNKLQFEEIVHVSIIMKHKNIDVKKVLYI